MCKLPFDRIIIIKLCIAMLLAGKLIFAQEECKVLMPEISGNYSGKCKKGLAHGQGKAIGTDTYDGSFRDGLPSGKGKYVWENGNIYIGDWEKGIRQGEGTFSFKENGKDTVISGLWENNRYTGPKPLPPLVITKNSIDRYNIYKEGNIKDRVLISFMQNGMRNSGLSNLLMNTDSGTETSLGYLVGYENIIFPVTIRVSYTTYNKLGTAQFPATFEFKIFEQGDWRVEIHN